MRNTGIFIFFMFITVYLNLIIIITRNQGFDEPWNSSHTL